MTNGIKIPGLLLLTVAITFLGINQEAFAMSYDDKLLLHKGLDEISSHINASKDLFEKGDYSMAISHLGHPIEEVYETLPISKITNKNFVDKLELSLFILKNTHPDIDYDDYHSQLSVIEKILDEGREISFYAELDYFQMQIQTTTHLLDLSKIEYSEGIFEGGTINNNIEIQDSYAFTETAKIILQNIETLHQKGAIFEKYFDDLEIAYSNTATPVEINTLIDKIISEIDLIEIPVTESDILSEINYRSIPEWVKNIALWWAIGEVNDDEFIEAIEFLINQGTIVVNNT